MTHHNSLTKYIYSLPLAFILYINDLASVLDGKVQFAKFADDLKIWREVKSDVDQEQLQNCLDSIAEWAANWQMDISVEKSFVMQIGSFSSKFNYKINGTTLSYVNSIKDLGIIVDTNLSYSAHCCAISKKASQRANMILRQARPQGGAFGAKPPQNFCLPPQIFLA